MITAMWISFFSSTHSQTSRCNLMEKMTKAFLWIAYFAGPAEEAPTNVSVSECFGPNGFYELPFQSKHAIGAFGMSFKLVEIYSCPENCFDCIGDQCCPIDYILQDNVCIAPITQMSSGHIQLQGIQDKENSEIMKDGGSHSELMIVVALVVGAIVMLAISRSCFLHLKRQRNGELELQFLKE